MTSRMEDGSATTTKTLNDYPVTHEVNVPDVVDCMEKLAVNIDMPEENRETVSGQRRSLRKHKQQNLSNPNLNRRCRLRPRKRNFEEIETEDQIKKYYLNKTIKKNTNSLETIFEEKEDMTLPLNYMSTKRFKRMIQFSAEPTCTKLKKRRDKIKKIFGSKLNLKKRKHVSMNTLFNKLTGLHKELTVRNPQEV